MDFVVSSSDAYRLSGEALKTMLLTVLKTGKRFRFCALGSSMTPFVKNGDVLTLVPTDAPIHYGEIVAFIHPANNRLTVHRVIGKQGDRYLLQGDNSTNCPDGLVAEESIFGKVVRVERGGRAVRVGIGPERIFIAFLSSKGWLLSVVQGIARVKRLAKGGMDNG